MMSRRDRRAAAREQKKTRPTPGADRAPDAPATQPAPSTTATPAAWFEAGLRLLQAGSLIEAEQCGRNALALDQGYADALHLMGLLSSAANQPHLAIEWLVKAVRAAPKPDYLSDLGLALKQAGRLDEALQTFDKAAQLKPDDAGLWLRVAGTLAALGRKSEAVLAYQHVLRLDPRQSEASFQCGLLLHEAGRLDEALACFDRCAELLPDHVRVQQARARALSGLKRFDECVTTLLRADTLEPGNIVTCNNIGNALVGLQRSEEALHWLDKALAIEPNSVEVLHNKAGALNQLGRSDEALAIFQRTVAIDPKNPFAAWNLAVQQLLMGDIQAGWRGHEALRWWRLPETRFSAPLWHGHEPLAGKTIVVWQDEGLGDTIQFARYVPLVAARGARVILVVDAPLQPLLSRLDGVSECHAKSPEMRIPPFDFHVPIYSLPVAFDTRLDTIPTGATCLPAPSADQVQAWDNRLGAHDRLRVGLVWSGNPSHPADQYRSIPFQTLSRLLDVDAQFISLQKDPRPSDLAPLRARPDIVDLTADLTDLSATAALISCLDVVITVDTAVAHLAAALGRPTWILIAHVPDWRWLLNRDDSPWYQTVRLFRQTAKCDYPEVVERAREELIVFKARRER